MAPKEKKAKAAPKEEPASKKAKTEEKKAEEVPKKAGLSEPVKAEEEPEVEKETNAKSDSREKVQDAIVFDSAESTLNVIPTMGGRVLMSLSEGGMQFLVAGARANVGLKAGRYMYEVKILEVHNPWEAPTKKAGWQGQYKRQEVRVGFSTAGSSLCLEPSDAAVAFDSEGAFMTDKWEGKGGSRFSKDSVVAVLLNLDPKSPNASTVSLFKDGVRASKPQPLPEALKGKVLFPHIAFKNVTVQVNFGPQPLKPLPFSCRILQDAAKDDVQVAASSVPKDGKYDVMFPVGFPDEGTFDWLDTFLESNPKYVELSDRMVQDWAKKSGLYSKRGNWGGEQYARGSKDKPGFNYQGMDDATIHKVLSAVTSAVPRHYVVMEVKQNLVAAERKENLKRFPSSKFKKTAHVMMGAPKGEYKKRVLSKILENKKKKAEQQWAKQQMEKKHKKLAEKRAKELEEKKKKAEEAKKEAEEKKAEEKKAEEKKEGEAEPAKEEEKEDVKKEDVKKEDVKMEEEKKDEEEEEEETMPEVELTEEEKALNFPPVHGMSDLTPEVLNASFAQFSIPEKSEGFDDVKFGWDKEKESKAYLQKLVTEKKITTPLASLQPGEWFKTKAAEFLKVSEEWKEKLKAYKPPAKVVAASKDGEEGEKAKSNVDIFSVVDVTDVGKGEPLFASFTFEDWTLFTLRYEFYLLIAGYKKDVDDPERIGIHESNFNFYYNKYFKKALSPKLYGKDTLAELLDLIKDTAKLDTTTSVLVSALEEETESADIFVKLTEDARRDRQRRIDAGDETARLKFQLLIQQQEQLKAAEIKRKQMEEQKAAEKAAAIKAAAAKAEAAKNAPKAAPAPNAKAPMQVAAPAKPAWQQQQQQPPKPAWQQQQQASAGKGGWDSAGKGGWDSGGKGSWDSGKGGWDSGKGGWDSGKGSGKSWDSGKGSGKDWYGGSSGGGWGGKAQSKGKW